MNACSKISERRQGMIGRHDVPASHFLVDEAAWPNVVTFFEGDGAGTLVAPAWILTAAHTARNIPPRHSVFVGGKQFRIDSIVHHGGSPGIENSNPDLALVRLASPVIDVRPIDLNDGTDELGREVLLLGRGDFGNGLVGPVATDGQLRRGTNRIDAVDHRWIKFRFDAPPAGTVLESVCGPGDSGGPALLYRELARPRIAGVSSWQDHPDGGEGRYGAIEHFARVSHYLGWIGAVCGI
jgi:hypothetical protein